MPLLDRFRLDRFRRDPAADAAAAFQAGDHARAFALWEKLAQAGDSRAQTNLGTCYAQGFGVPRHEALALHWLSVSATAGYAPGERNLADFLMVATVPDPARAAALYRRAAEAGDARAQDMLSWMLLEGDTLPSDPVEARRWAGRAAEQGVAAAMTRLGLIFHNALGTERDPAEAARWWGEAARRGDADGQAMLGAALHMGAGLERDGVDALAWLLRATDGGSKLARPFLGPARDALDANAVAEARRRAAEALP